MGQIDDNGFNIKKDGTIVRSGTSSKISKMKKKLSSGDDDGDNKRSKKRRRSSKVDNISGWIVFICVIGGALAGAVESFQYDYGFGEALWTTFIGLFLGLVVGGLISIIIEKIFK